MWLPVALLILVGVACLVCWSAYDDWRQVEEMHHEPKPY